MKEQRNWLVKVKGWGRKGERSLLLRHGNTVEEIIVLAVSRNEAKEIAKQKTTCKFIEKMTASPSR